MVMFAWALIVVCPDTGARIQATQSSYMYMSAVRECGKPEAVNW